MRASVKTILLGKIPKSIAALAALASFTTCLQAQISVGVGGAGPITFDGATTLNATEWSTRDTIGGDAATYGTPASVDVGAQTNLATLITDALPTIGANGTDRRVRHNTAAGYITSTPTGVPASILLATLRNDSGDNILSFTVTYDSGVQNATTSESAFGFRVFWSLSGLPGSWNLIPSFSGLNTTVTVSTNLQVSGWANGANMYFLWYDDNAGTNPDGFYTIDNFGISAVVNGAVPCPGIAANPVSISRQQCFDATASFSITATGAVAGVQWYRQDGGGGFNPIVGANGSTYTLPSYTVGADNGAQFRAIVTNSTGCSATSSVATLTVVADIVPPSPLYAVRYLTPTNITLTNITVVFSEPIDTNNADLWTNFSLSDTNTGNQVVMLGQLFLNSTTMVLLTDDTQGGTLDPTHGYALELFNVFDACANNEMPTVTIPVYSFVSTPLPLTATWKYFENDDPGATWFETGFNDSGWLSGSGPFDMKRFADYPAPDTDCRSNTLYMLQGPVPTCLLMTNPVTTFTNLAVNFRTHFNYAGNTNQTLLQLSGKFDDGAIVYLNGHELTRIGLPGAPTVITRTTVPNRTVGDTEGRDIALFIANTNLHTGDNVVAVQLNQNGVTSSDLTMGLEFHAFTLEQLAAPVVPPHVSISNNGGVFTVTWTPTGGALQRSLDIGSPANWVTIPGASSPFITNAPPAIQFFRVLP